MHFSLSVVFHTAEVPSPAVLQQLLNIGQRAAAAAANSRVNDDNPFLEFFVPPTSGGAFIPPSQTTQPMQQVCGTLHITGLLGRMAPSCVPLHSTQLSSRRLIFLWFADGVLWSKFSPSNKNEMFRLLRKMFKKA